MDTLIPPDTWIDRILIGPSCWEHENRPGLNGYRQSPGGRRGKRFMAHRVMYEWLRGPILPGLQIDHLCRNRGCINPWHMEPVTQKENILRGESPPARNSRKEVCAAKGHPLAVGGNGKRYCAECAKARKRKPEGEPRKLPGPKSHCVHGHEFTPENTRINKHGRRCRTCHRERMAMYTTRVRDRHNPGSRRG